MVTDGARLVESEDGRKALPYLQGRHASKLPREAKKAGQLRADGSLHIAQNDRVLASQVEPALRTSSALGQGGNPRAIPKAGRSDSSEAQELMERVFIIEDDRSVRSALVNLISATGLEAVSFDSVDSFMDEAVSALAGCFLLDIKLPGVSGLEFLTEMKARHLHLPVILISGYGDVPLTVQGMKAGAIDFLTKPFRPNEVLEAVSRGLQLDRKRRQIRSDYSNIVARFESLSRRERQVMSLVTAGKMNKQTAGILGLSEITVKVYRAALMRKMQVRTLADLVRISEQLSVNMPNILIGQDAKNDG